MVLVAVLALAVAPAVHADFGPKPSVDISVTHDGQTVKGDFYSVMLKCHDPNDFTRDSGLSESIGIQNESIIMEALSIANSADKADNCTWTVADFAWGGDCYNGECSFRYSLPEKFKLVVYTPGDGMVFVSNMTDMCAKTCSAELLENGEIIMADTTTYELLLGYETDLSLQSFLTSLTINILLETPIAAILFKIKKVPLGMLKYAALVNVVSLLCLWLFYALLGVNMVSEVIVVSVEAALLYVLLRREGQDVSKLESIGFSLAMNIGSIVLGMALIVVLMSLGVIAA